MPLDPILSPLIAALSPSQRLANQRTGTEFGEPRSLLQQHKADSAWVLLFNPGERNEGVYTLQGRETPGAPHGTYVLAFEEQEEASRFAMLLQVRRASSRGPFYLGAWIPPAPNPRVTPGARVRPGDGDEVDVGAAGRLLRRGRLRPRFRAGCLALDAARAELFRR